MNCVCNQFFSRAAFSGNEHRRLRGGHLCQTFEQPSHGFTVPDDVTEIKPIIQSFLQKPIFLLELMVTQGSFYKYFQLIDVQRFGEVVEGPLFQCLYSRVNGGEGRDNDDGGLGIDVPVVPLFGMVLVKSSNGYRGSCSRPPLCFDKNVKKIYSNKCCMGDNS